MLLKTKAIFPSQMISFIIIGKNIENTISTCLNSVFRFIKTNNIIDYEVIYVDSDSVDSSISIAQKYPVTIFQLQGEVNSAIGRNIGVKNSKGDILFMVDGDMELLPDFYKSIFNENTRKLLYPFNNGYLCHKYYDDGFKNIYIRCEKIPDKPIYRSVTGGLMIVDRHLWEKLDGMDERLIRNQDLDFGLRMAKIGIPAKLHNELFAFHHTSEYFNKNRFSDFYFSRALLSSGILMRKYVFNWAYLKRYYMYVINVVILIMVFGMLIFNPIISVLLLIIYFILQCIRTIKTIEKRKYILRSFTFKFFFSFYCLYGLLCYYPPKPRYTITKLS
jgi:glycosyltransferase involved in cell wall biosynthesis